MELEQLSCCGIFELCNISDVLPRDVWNEKTGQYETKPPRGRTRREQIKFAIQNELEEIDPKGRLVFATTVPNMRAAAQALRDLHFRVVRRFTNGNTGNRITVWMKLVR